ncbi:hypothetical protein EVAR_37591_1 [Eumeta japonica]|uniref:Uncharacterized protein n=1 Tax=Eumeta variegata TaxID=151549 RepID=A0A4C1VNT1_EUMVA|nr:hypothetical protein EVAR_37591_1 [Eumeta japonica]
MERALCRDKQDAPALNCRPAYLRHVRFHILSQSEVVTPPSLMYEPSYDGYFGSTSSDLSPPRRPMTPVVDATSPSGTDGLTCCPSQESPPTRAPTAGDDFRPPMECRSSPAGASGGAIARPRRVVHTCIAPYDTHKAAFPLDTPINVSKSKRQLVRLGVVFVHYASTWPDDNGIKLKDTNEETSVWRWGAYIKKQVCRPRPAGASFSCVDKPVCTATNTHPPIIRVPTVGDDDEKSETVEVIDAKIYVLAALITNEKSARGPSRRGARGSRTFSVLPTPTPTRNYACEWEATAACRLVVPSESRLCVDVCIVLGYVLGALLAKAIFLLAHAHNEKKKSSRLRGAHVRGRADRGDLPAPAPEAAAEGRTTSQLESSLNGYTDRDLLFVTFLRKDVTSRRLRSAPIESPAPSLNRRRRFISDPAGVRAATAS